MLALLLGLQLVGVGTSATKLFEAAGSAGKIAVLQAWVDAVERHRPGEIDEATDRARRISRAELDRLRVDLRTVVKLIRDPKASVFYLERLTSLVTPRSVQLIYTADELRALREIAAATADRGGGNRLLKRAAVLHTDLALIVQPDSSTPRTAGPASSLQRTTTLVEDGRQVARFESIDHWEMSRRLLDEIRSNPDRDPDPQTDAGARIWYVASLAYFLNIHHVTLPHFIDAVRVFPNDPDVLFLSGAMREMASAPGVYTTVRRSGGPSSEGLGSEESELGLAESLYRRALAANPALAEARLRLGRVLTRLGRAEDAAKELRLVAAAIGDQRLSYYGQLFLGGALDRLRDTAGARAAYERAATLYPLAQSPQLALSQLAARAGDRRAALQVAAPTLSPRADTDDDPLWTYHVTAGRDAQQLMERMYQTLAPGPAPERGR
jgi:tetratricopeptide (TPR) repeat protein